MLIALGHEGVRPCRQAVGTSMVIRGTSHLDKDGREFFEIFSLCLFDLFICVCCVRDFIKIYAKRFQRRQLESHPFGSFKPE